jgi:hypothetical protein
MAITHVATQFESNAAGATAGNLVVAVPAGTQNGDVMLAFVYKAADSVHTVTAPAGWTAVSSGAVDTTNIYGNVWYRVASSEPSNYTWTISSTGIWGAAISTFRGVSTGAPINANSGASYTTQDPATAPTVTTTAATNIVTFRASRDDSTAEVTHTATDTELADWGNDGGASTRNGAIYFSTEVTAGAGRGGLSVNPSGSVTNGVMFTIALAVLSETSANAGITTSPTLTTNKPTPTVKVLPTVIG